MLVLEAVAAGLTMPAQPWSRGPISNQQCSQTDVCGEL